MAQASSMRTQISNKDSELVATQKALGLVQEESKTAKANRAEAALRVREQRLDEREAALRAGEAAIRAVRVTLTGHLERTLRPLKRAEAKQTAPTGFAEISAQSTPLATNPTAQSLYQTPSAMGKVCPTQTVQPASRPVPNANLRGFASSALRARSPPAVIQTPAALRRSAAEFTHSTLGTLGAHFNLKDLASSISPSALSQTPARRPCSPEDCTPPPAAKRTRQNDGHEDTFTAVESARPFPGSDSAVLTAYARRYSPLNANGRTALRPRNIKCSHNKTLNFLNAQVSFRSWTSHLLWSCSIPVQPGSRVRTFCYIRGFENGGEIQRQTNFPLSFLPPQ
ncbi:hypothetical protein B0H16DRAFT_1597962 [Mycena metata]|uniref:Uncharacterized protein n=1 Tax=Mycena metata TaxID=1033252 RepID=A0AAD7MM36_9AGAR|nr:hypothetical protein B0H16DRAFT_1597962 [Mycena metata]